jgi:LysR family transcriptional regulator (chromosome initiation inhibitor)
LVRSRPIRPTTAGRLLIKHAVQLRLLRSDLETDLQDLTPGAKTQREEDRISIAINADSIATWALPALSPLVNAGLPLEIITDDQDFTHEWLREGQVLGCVTTLKLALRGCKVLPLGDMRYVAVASKSFAAALCPQGLNAHNFRQIPFIAFNRKDDLQADFVGRALGLRRVALSQRFVPSSEGQVHAVQAGWGASVVPQLLVQQQLASGELVNLAPDFSLPVSLYWHCWNLDSIVIDRLTQALAAGAASALTDAGGAAA